MTLVLREMVPLYPDHKKAVFFDDFLGAQYNTSTWAIAGTGSAATQLAVGGVLRLLPDIRKDMTLFLTPVDYLYTSNYEVEMRLKYEATAGVASYVEWGTQQSPSGITYAVFRATNDASLPNVMVAGDGTWYNTGVAYSAATYHVYRMTVSSGLIHWYIDGVRVATKTTAGPVTAQAPFIYVASGSKLTSAVYIDYVLATGDRV